MTTQQRFQTEIEFTLPKGFVDDAGELHRNGVMRLATAADEILPLRDPRVQQNEAYFAVIVLSRVIVQLGSLVDIHPGVIEGLYASDLSFLQNLYERFNSNEPMDSSTTEQKSYSEPKENRMANLLGEA
ncbi:MULTISPECIES: hypothetical protein [Gimesia]|uniref:Phage tail protein E n=2 Tax=Gimesia TaxID=1649453 RepID=A0A517VZW6_9PLAN|nr:MULTISPECIES: hypothetical protein [Gimesia]QDT98551.1 hypothetical protein V144x_40580 [Gimesia aquarii]QDV49892.1 hypothetical protein Enr17x_19130 [Gimesia fumaroli]